MRPPNTISTLSVVGLAGLASAKRAVLASAVDAPSTGASARPLAVTCDPEGRLAVAVNFAVSSRVLRTVAPRLLARSPGAPFTFGLRARARLVAGAGSSVGNGVAALVSCRPGIGASGAIRGEPGADGRSGKPLANEDDDAAAKLGAALAPPMPPGVGGDLDVSNDDEDDDEVLLAGRRVGALNADTDEAPGTGGGAEKLTLPLEDDDGAQEGAKPAPEGLPKVGRGTTGGGGAT